MNLRQEISVQDAGRAIRIFEEFMHRVGVDRETGRFDIDVIATGITHSQHDRIRIITGIVAILSRDSPKKFAMEDDIIAEATKQGINPEAARKALEMGLRNNTLFAKGGRGTYASLSDAPLITPRSMKNEAERIKAILNYIRSNPSEGDLGVNQVAILEHMLLEHHTNIEQTSKDLERLTTDGVLYRPKRHDHYMIGRN